MVDTESIWVRVLAACYGTTNGAALADADDWPSIAGRGLPDNDCLEPGFGSLSVERTVHTHKY